MLDFQNGGAGNPRDPVRAFLFLMGLPQRRLCLNSGGVLLLGKSSKALAQEH